MKRVLFGLCFLVMAAFAGIANAEEPAILADLTQNNAVQAADAATLDAAQGANYMMYKVAFKYGTDWVNDSRSRKFSNWSKTGVSQLYYSNTVYGTIYTNAASMLVWKENTNYAGSPWCTSR